VEMARQLRSHLALENGLTKEFWIGRPLTLSDLVRELLKRGMTDRTHELRAKTSDSTLVAKLSGR